MKITATGLTLRKGEGEKVGRWEIDIAVIVKQVCRSQEGRGSQELFVEYPEGDRGFRDGWWPKDQKQSEKLREGKLELEEGGGLLEIIHPYLSTASLPEKTGEGGASRTQLALPHGGS